MKHYLCFGGRFNIGYMYFDLNVDEGQVADSLFYKRNIPIKFGDEFAKENDKYKAIFCKIKRKYMKDFEEALEELKNKMDLLGHLDYEEYCMNIINSINEGLVN